MANTKNARHEKDNRLNSWGTTCRGDSDGMTAMQKKTRRGTARFGRAVDPHAIQEDCRTAARERESMQESGTSGGAVCARRVGGHTWLKVLVFVLLFAVVFGVCFGATSEGIALANDGSKAGQTYYVHNQVDDMELKDTTITLELNDANADGDYGNSDNGVYSHFAFSWSYGGNDVSMSTNAVSNGIYFNCPEDLHADTLNVYGIINVKTPTAIKQLIAAGLVEKAEFSATFKSNYGDDNSVGVALSCGSSYSTPTSFDCTTTLTDEGQTTTPTATLSSTGFGSNYDYFYCKTAAKATGVIWPGYRRLRHEIYNFKLVFTLHYVPYFNVGVPRATADGEAAKWSRIVEGLKYAYSGSEVAYANMTTTTTAGEWTKLHFWTLSQMIIHIELSSSAMK